MVIKGFTVEIDTVYLTYRFVIVLNRAYVWNSISLYNKRWIELLHPVYYYITVFWIEFHSVAFPIELV